MDLHEQTATKGALSRREFLTASAALAATAGPGRGQSFPSTDLIILGPVVRVERIGGVPTFVVNGKPMLRAYPKTPAARNVIHAQAKWSKAT